MGRFDPLTQYIPLLNSDAQGEWVIDITNDETHEGPVQMPYVPYAKVIRKFMEDTYMFCEAHPEYDHTQYGETLGSLGIEWNTKDMSSADVSNMDAKGVIALLIGALRADRFCEGSLLRFLENGSILRWLERLQQINLE